jgi:hypothetical protein
MFLQALFQSAQHIYEKREGSGAGSVPLTYGSRSGRPKKLRILRIRIRIPNTVYKSEKTRLLNWPYHCPHQSQPSVNARETKQELSKAGE